MDILRTEQTAAGRLSWVTGDMENWTRALGNGTPSDSLRVQGCLEFEGLLEGSPRIDDLRRDLVRIPDQAAAMAPAKAGPWASGASG